MLNARNLKLSFGSRVILDDVSISLLARERVALVGQNGVGKSTLLSILAGFQPDDGRVEYPKELRIGYLKQVPDLDKDLTVTETVRLGMAEHLALIKEHQTLCHELASMSDGPVREKLIKKIDELTRQIDLKGGFDVDYWVERVLTRLGVRAREQTINTLSGGERRRVDLARILLLSPDIFLLDEPTNHLDVSAIEFLVETFSNTKAGLIFISHDTRFVDELATKILELANAKIFSHDPPFANYLENKVLREAIDARSLHRRERLMVGELAWLRAGTPARTTKQNARIDRAYELMDSIERDFRTQNKKRLEIENATAKRLGNTIVELQEVGVAYGDRVLFKNLNLKVVSGQRFGILGSNGAGKTTLLSILAKKIVPNFGQIVFGKNTAIIQFDQQREQLNGNNTLKETLADHGDYVHVGEQKYHIASYLEKYLFAPDDANRKVATLSGGEQNRLLLAKLFRHDANCLLLDEPTNDLDVSSLAVLEEALLAFDGVVFVVSHDRNFLDRVCNAIIAFVPEGVEHRVDVFPGNYSDYLVLSARANKEREEEKSVAPQKAPEKAERVKIKKKRSFKEEREYQKIERVIEGLEHERDQLHGQLADGSLFKDEKGDVEEKLARLHVVEGEIERLYARWQELSDLGG